MYFIVAILIMMAVGGILIIGLPIIIISQILLICSFIFVVAIIILSPFLPIACIVSAVKHKGKGKLKAAFNTALCYLPIPIVVIGIILPRWEERGETDLIITAIWIAIILGFVYFMAYSFKGLKRGIVTSSLTIIILAILYLTFLDDEFVRLQTIAIQLLS